MTEIGALLERWHAVWLLTPGWTAAAVGRALERDAHTTGQWAQAFAERAQDAGFRADWWFPPRWTWRNAGSCRQRRRGRRAVAGRRRTVQLERAGSAPICGGSFRADVAPERWSEPPASAGLCAEASPEAATQSGPGAPGRLCGGICCSCRRCPTNRSQDVLRRRGPLSGGC